MFKTNGVILFKLVGDIHNLVTEPWYLVSPFIFGSKSLLHTAVLFILSWRQQACWDNIKGMLSVARLLFLDIPQRSKPISHSHDPGKRNFPSTQNFSFNRVPKSLSRFEHKYFGHLWEKTSYGGAHACNIPHFPLYTIFKIARLKSW